MKRKFQLHYEKELLNIILFIQEKNFLFIQEKDDWYSTTIHYAKCDVIRAQNRKGQTKTSHQQSTVTQKYKSN